MGKLNRVMTTALLAQVALGACSEPAAPAPELVAARKRAAEAAAKPTAPVDPRFDAQGRLRPAGRHVSWLELPVGFTERPGSTAQTASFEARDMPFAKVREYLEARIRPDRIEYRGNGTSFRDALPSHTRLSLPPMNLTILETDREHGEIRLSVDDLTPPTTAALPPASAARELAKDRARAE
jgi:hypothetical protein